MNNYVDKIGRTHTKPIKNGEDYSTNNAWIYTAIHHVLMQMNSKATPTNKLVEAVKSCEIQKGLYARHPKPYSSQPNMVPVSHDEIIGISILFSPISYQIALKSETDPYFCDLPGYENKPRFSLFAKAKALFSYANRVILKKENQRRITRDYPELYGLFFTHRRQYRYIYESLAMRNTNPLNAASWFISRVFDLLTDGIGLLHYISMVKMEMRLNESFLFKIIKKMTDRSIIKKYGGNPIEKMLEEYLLKNTGTVDKNHPWLIEIREYYNKENRKWNF